MITHMLSRKAGASQYACTARVLSAGTIGRKAYWRALFLVGIFLCTFLRGQLWEGVPAAAVDIVTGHVTAYTAGRENTAEAMIADEDWPMWRYDAARSAQTPVVLSDTLHPAWVRELPAPQRAWRQQWDDQGKLDFDVSYSPVVAGERIFVPSNVTDSVTAYSIDDGTELWRFYADGPVRLAPVVWKDRVYFVADDGYLYCVDARDGILAWKFRGGPSDHRLLGNERIISFWAARGGPVIKGGILYFAAGIWPMHGVFIYALDAASGAIIWVNDTTSARYVQLPHEGASALGSIAPQGYIAATEDCLVVAGGRTPPAFLNRHTGEVEEMALRAKPEGGYAVHGDGMGFKRNETLTHRVKALSDHLDSAVFNKLAAHGRLFVTTEKGTLYCFAPEVATPVMHTYRPAGLAPKSEGWAEHATYFVDELGKTEGYALLLGVGSGDLLRELLVQSRLHIVVVESAPDVVRALRDEMSAAGLYGRRVAVIESEPRTFAVQPYLFSLVVSEDALSAGISPDTETMAHLLDRIRPYDGIAYLGVRQETTSPMARAARDANVDRVQIEQGARHILAKRGGPLTGAGQWTHQHGDVSNQNFSTDSRARAPLGLLWFGGPCNNNILPRHGHGPVPQVVRGRTVLLGPDTVSARCVYTGRQLWERGFPGLGHPFTDVDLEAQYQRGESVFMHDADGVGANQIGSPFVTLPDAVYVRYGPRIHRLAPESGETTAEFQLPVRSQDIGRPDWGYLGVWDDVIITTTTPQVFEANRYTEAYQSLADIKSRNWDGTSSERLVVMDRHSGEVLWTREAQTGFRHNAIAAGGGRIYLIDGLSPDLVARRERRGEAPEEAVLMALEPRTGAVKWRGNTNIFGTWLGYSALYDLLMQGGRPGGLRSLEDEPGDRIAVYRGDTGTPVWEEVLPPYWGPLAIRNDKLYLAPSARSGMGYAINLLTGEQIQRGQLPTGERADWSYRRRYGCNSHNLSEHLITFRSGAAAYFDLANDSGTGFFGGVRSGCTNNMVVADGVVNAPDYTRTCTCSYQHQTSLALIHMPHMSSIEAWTIYDGAPPDPSGYGLNFGAPGRRVDHSSGRVWHDQEGAHRRHSSAIENTDGGGLDWVAASAREMNNAEDSVIEVNGLHETGYTVRFHFAELQKEVGGGKRIFDVIINGEVALNAVDIVARTGAPFRGFVETVVVHSGGTLTIELRRTDVSQRYPIINGIEFIARDVLAQAVD